MRRLTSWIAILLFAVSAQAQITNTAHEREVAENFGKEIAEAFNQRDRKALARLIDFHALMEAAADFQGLTGSAREGYLRGAGNAGLAPLLDNYFNVLDASHGSVKFMRATNTFPPRPLVRFDMREKGFNYLEYYLVTDDKGNARAKDWYQLATGDLVSVTIAGVMQIFTSTNPGLLDRLLGAKPDTTTVETLSNIGKLQRAGKYPEALAQYKNLPEQVANTRLILTLHAATANLANQPAEHERVLTTMARLYASDPAAAFMLLDYYFAKRDMPRLMKTLDIVEKRIGVDGNTCMVRANAYYVNNDLQTALKYADDAIRTEPDLLQAHDTRGIILVRLTRYPEAVDGYREMEKNFGFQLKRENFSDPVYKDFVASKAFKAWLPR